MKQPLTPGLQAMKDNPDVVFLELDTDDTDPVITQGFTDEQIKEMQTENLKKEVAECNRQEQQLNQLLTDLRTRKFVLNEILMRKMEL